jgi:hypothetical protein
MRHLASQVAIASGTLWISARALASPNTFFFEVSDIVSPKQPYTNITLWAAFEPDNWFAFGETRTEVRSAFDPGGFSDPIALLDPWRLSEPGDVSPDGDRVSGIYAMQIYVPFSIYPDSGTPIPIWSVTWSTDDFTPRQVDLGTQSETFKLYTEEGDLIDQFGIDFAEGAGVITVLPGPGSLAVLGCAGAWSARRRRRHSAV